MSVKVLSESVAWTVGQRFEVTIRKNGSPFAQSDNQFVQATVTTFVGAGATTIVNLSVGDTIDAVILHDRGSDTDTTPSSAENYISIAPLH